MIEKIVSGDQIGADIAALDVAQAGSRESKELGIHDWVKGIVSYAFFRGEDHPGMLGGPGEG
jgi:hypothetical protein